MIPSLQTSLMPALLAWLLTYAIHSTMLLGGAWFASRRMALSPVARDVLWKVAIIGGVITSLAQQGISSPMTRAFALDASVPTAPVQSAPQVTSREPSVRGDLAAALRVESAARPRDEQIPAPSQSAASGETSASAWSQRDWTVTAVTAWAILAGVLTLAYVARRLVLIGRLANRRVVAEGPLPAMLDALRLAARHRSHVRLSWVNTIASPVALGTSEICLPEAALTDLEPEEQRSLLAHELAHLTRRDPVWLVLIAVIERIFFFQPLNHVARASLQRNAEFLCDDFAATQTGSGLPLAHCLARVAEWMEATPLGVPVAGMAEQRSLLVTRIARLIERRNAPPHASRFVLALGAVGALAVMTAAAPAVRTLEARTLASGSEAAAGSEALAPAKDADSALSTGNASRQSASVKDLSGPMTATVSDPLDNHKQDEALPLRDAPLPVKTVTTQDTAGDQDPVVVAALIERLKDSDAGVRRAAANSLGNLKSKKAVPALMAAAGDKNREVRMAVIEALSELEDAAAIPVLLKALSDENAEVRMHALDGLGNFHDELQSAPFIPLLKDANPEVRARAIERLGEIADQSSAAAIVPALKDTNAEVRREALGALKELGDRSVAPSILPLLRDTDADVRSHALDALSELKASIPEASMLSLLEDASPDVRSNALEYVRENPSVPLIPTLKKLLDDPVGDVRENAVEALAAYRDPSARLALRGALTSEDPKVRRRAAEALGERR